MYICIHELIDILHIIYDIPEAQKDFFLFYHLVASDVVVLIATTPLRFDVAVPVFVLLE